jgi:hypothetical protein
MRVYKTVTVFATLIAVVAVLAGFVLGPHDRPSVSPRGDDRDLEPRRGSPLPGCHSPIDRRSTGSSSVVADSESVSRDKVLSPS